MSCVFCRIINREIPARIFFETDQVLVIADHRPKDRVHLLVIPKQEYRNFYHTPPDVLDLMNQTVRTVVEKLGITDHFRLVINNGYGQEVDHVHYHILSDRGSDKLTWLA
jgi:histidine triad (HIT) family protein